MKSTTEVVNKLTFSEVVNNFYLKGVDAENKKDMKSAEMYYNFAAQKGCPKSLCGLGRICEGRNDKKNADIHYQNAAKIYHAKARNGCSQSQFSLGCMYQDGKCGLVNLTLALNFYKLAADKGHADAQCALADMYMKGQGIDIDQQQAFIYYQKSSNQDHPKANYELAWMYYTGTVVEQDLGKYAKLILESAAQNYAPAEYDIGTCADNNVLTIDKKIRFEYIKRAADHGHIQALNFAAMACFQHEEPDCDRARAYIERLDPKDRDTSSICILGIIYFNGMGVEQDKAKGKIYFDSVMGSIGSREDLIYHAIAQTYLGTTYLDSQSGVKSIKEAHRYFSLAMTKLKLNDYTKESLTPIIENALKHLDFVDLISLISLILQEEQMENEQPMRIFQPGIKYLYDMYANMLRLRAKRQILTDQEQSIVDRLPVLEEFSPKRALELAIQELSKNDKEFRPKYLKAYLDIPCSNKEFGNVYFKGAYYRGLCYLMGIFKGYQFEWLHCISLSAQKGFTPALNYMKFNRLTKNDSGRIELLINAGAEAERNQIYQVARFYYNKALSLDRSNVNLLRCAFFESYFGELTVATKYYLEILKKNPGPEILHFALEFFTKTDIKRALMLLDGQDKLYNCIKDEAEKGNWQETLYFQRELYLADRLFSKNKMQQGFKYIEQIANKGYPNAILMSALCYLQGWGVKPNAIEAWNRLFSIKTHSVAAYYLGILSLHKTDQMETARQYFNQFGDKEPLINEYLAHSGSAAGLIYLGNKACEVNFFRIALLHYTQALKLEPENAEALFKMAFCYMQWDEYDVALKHLEKALQLDKTHEQAQMAEAMCCMKLGIVRAQTEPVFLMTEEPVQEVMPEPEPESFQLVKMSRKVRKKRVQNSESRNISSYKDSIFSCTTSEQFMDIFYKITASSPPVSLRESMKTWVDEHAEYQHRILQILKEKGDLYAEYIEEWGLHALENRVTETAVSTPVIEPVEVPVIPQIPNAKKSSTEVRPTLKEKRQIKDMHARNRKITDMIGKLHWIPQYKELLAELHRYMNQQITSDILHGNEALKFAECIHAFQDRRNYKILCDVYAFFTLEERNMHQYPAELHKYFLDIQIIMQDVHRGIEILIEQSYVFCNKFCFEYRPEMYASINNINRLYSVFNGFHTDRTAMNKELKQKNAARIFGSVPLVVGDIYTLFEPACEALFVAGSFLRKQYEQSQNPLDTDLDIVLINPDIKKLIELRCARNIHITDKEVYTFQYGRSRSHWIPVDILCIRKPANMSLEEILLEDIKLRDLKSALHGNSLGAIKNTSGVAFHHLDNHIIDIPGNSIERAHQEPLLMLRVIAEELRIMLQFRKKPEIAENVLIAFKTFTRNPDFEKQEGHIHAFMRKCIKKYGAVDMAKKLVEYGLLHHLFEITHEEDWGKTASLLEKKVTKEFLPVQVAVKENSALVLSSIFQPEKKDEVLDEKGADLGFGSSK